MTTKTRRVGVDLIPTTDPFVIVPAARGHAVDIARLHMSCIDRGFLSTLGTRVLSRLYNAMRVHPGTDLLVCLHRDQVVGFVAVTESTGRLYKWILQHKSLSIGLPMMRKMFSVSRIKRIVETLLYPSTTSVQDLPSAELLSMAVDPALRGFGIGRKLVFAGLQKLAARNVPAVRVACGAALASNGFYQRLGFHLALTTDHHGAPTNLYTRVLAAAPQTPVIALTEGLTVPAPA